MKLLLIGGDSQPIPPVNGGAVENLIKLIYDQNEIFKKFDLDILSCDDDKISKIELKKHYLHTNYYYLKKMKRSKFNRFITALCKKIFNMNLLLQNAYSEQIVSFIKKNRKEYDFILVENYIECVLPIAKLCPDSKIVLHLHNDKLNDGTFRAKKILNSCDLIITVSDYIADRVKSIDEHANVCTIINSINIKEFYKENILLRGIKKRAELNYKKDDFLIVYTGRISKVKGVLELVQALKKIDNEKIKLLIMGNSWYGKASRFLADKYGETLKEEAESIRDRIFFTGYIDYEEIPTYYAMANLVVIPSVWQEPCSLTLLEAMAAKKPLLSTKVGGTPEVVKDYAELVNADDKLSESLAKAILSIYTNYSCAENKAEKAFQYVQQYNPERYYKLIYDALERIK